LRRQRTQRRHIDDPLFIGQRPQNAKLCDLRLAGARRQRDHEIVGRVNRSLRRLELRRPKVDVRRPSHRELGDEVTTKVGPSIRQIAAGSPAVWELDVKALVPEIPEKMNSQRRDPPDGDVSDVASGRDELGEGRDSGLVALGLAGKQCSIGEPERAKVGRRQGQHHRILGAEFVVCVREALRDRFVGVFGAP
jgi:hypothetical protein